MSDRVKLWVWVLFLFGGSGLAVGSAFAQNVTATDGGFQRMMNGIVRGTPGITNVPVSGGVRTSATGAVNVTARGITIPINTTASASVSGAAIAKGAMRVGMRALPWVGTALIVRDLTTAVKDSGYVVCPPPGFFCKAAEGTEPPVPDNLEYRYSPPTADSPWSKDPATACTIAAAQSASKPQSDGVTFVSFTVSQSPTPANNLVCKIYTPGIQGKYAAGTFTRVLETRQVCDDGSLPNASGYCGYYDPTKPVTPITPQELETQIQQAMATGKITYQDMKNNLDAVANQNPALAPPVDVTAAPLTVTAPAVTLPPKILITRTIENPDGTTSTETVKESVTVAPQVGLPSTVGEPNVTFPSTSTVTTTVVNNVTNVTNTKTEVINNPAPPISESKPTEKEPLPTDYNRENTQLSILGILTEWAKPITETVADGETEVAQVQEQNNKNLAVVDGVTVQSLGISSWFPMVPTATCVNPQVPMPLSDATVAFPICGAVDTFSLFISGVLAFFCILGCVHQVQLALKA